MNNKMISVSRGRAADSLYLTMWPNETLHECEIGNPKYAACLKAIDAGYQPAAQHQGEPVAWRVTGRGGLTVTPEYPKWATGKGSEGLKVEALVVAEQPAQKYDDTLLPFVALMRKELHANAGKGDRPGWLAMSSDTCLLEIIYHFGKLQASVKRGDGDGMAEYGADVANMCMMLLDICGVLARVEQPWAVGNHTAGRRLPQR